MNQIINQTTNEDFIHLHVHTDDSNLRLKDSIAKVKNIIEYANKLGNTGVAITDHECLSNHIEAINTVNTYKKEGKIPNDFKIILGNEIYLVDKNKINELKHKKEKITFYHSLLLSKDEIGHKQLRELSSRAWRDNYFSYRGLDRVPTFYSDIEEVIGENKGHLIMSTACIGSYLGSLSKKLMITENEDEQLSIKEEMAEFIEWGLEWFNDDFYLEMQPNTSEEQVFYNNLLIRISESYDIPLIITTDVHFIDEDTRDVHKAFLTSDEDDVNREVDDFYETTRFFDTQEIYDYMNYIDKNVITKAILNTKEIKNKINSYDWFATPKIPLTPLPNEEEWYPIDINVIRKYKNIYNLYNDKYIYHKYLIHRIFKGIEYRNIPIEDMKETLDRIDLECSELIGISESLEQPVGAYLTTMEKNMEIIWEKSVVGCGRGSAVGWIINYLLDITQINPLKQEGMKLQHWRFLTKDRPDMPDIDIDYSSHLKNTVFAEVKKYYESIGGSCVRVATFRTETSKSAILTACRGLKINNDVAQYISSLVNIERGFVWSISDMYYGNAKKGRQPITEFVNIVDKYEDKGLLKAMLTIEGLKSGCSSHASGVICLNEPLENTNSYMRTPSGELITAYDLHESESLSNIKFDFLLTNGISLIQLCIEMLVKAGHMKWQGDLKSTYNKYLLPEYIDKTSDELWDLICQGKLMNIFQFETPVGSVAIQKLQPRSLLDLANANSLMRLMNPNEEQPLDKYIRFRNNPELWEKEMINYGLTKEEREIMHKELDNQYGVCSNQESMMEMFMNPKISNFNIKEANLIRKAVAKKSEKALKEAEELYYKKGRELGTSENLLNYCWNVQTGYQKGYAFSLLHTDAYSTIAIQEGNLFIKYPNIYWYTANLLSMSGSLDEEIIEDDYFKTKEQTTNYGKTAKAIYRVQSEGVEINLPDINNSELGFIPNEIDNSILFGLKGISSINNDTSKFIINNRPYSSLRDFHNKLVGKKREVISSTGKKQMKSYVSISQTITLIKAGAFDKLERKERIDIIEDYLKLLYPYKKSLTTRNIDNIIELGIVSDDYKTYIRYYNFKNFLNTLHSISDNNSKKIKWVIINCENDDITEYTLNFLNEYFMNEMEEDKGYRYNEKGQLEVALGTTRKGSFEYIYNNYMDTFKKWMNSKDCLDTYNKITFDSIKNEYMNGSLSSWEMDSLGMYYNDHELINVNKDEYGIVNFNELNEKPTVNGYNEWNGIKYPKYELVRIAGTVLDRDKNKHMVTLLTLDGVVTLKFYSGQFGFYDKTISIVNEETGKKTTLENGWFKKGEKLLVTGFRRDDTFVPKKYKNSIYKHTVQRILSIDDNGKLELQSERTQINKKRNDICDR